MQDSCVLTSLVVILSTRFCTEDTVRHTVQEHFVIKRNMFIIIWSCAAC